jgi:hypothetical protein
MKTLPPLTTGLPNVDDPSAVAHRMFFLEVTSHSVGRFFSGDARFRSVLPHHKGQSAAAAGKGDNVAVPNDRHRAPSRPIVEDERLFTPQVAHGDASFRCISPYSDPYVGLC